jgi:predicted SnoaL-like aldol condensation-catalyzing enzyme
MSNLDAATDFLTLASSGHVKQAFSQYVDSSFKHHNPFFEAGPGALAAAMDDNAKQHPAKVCTIHHAVANDNLVIVHSHVRMAPDELGVATMHVFRFVDGKIVELWDVGQPVPAESPNTDGMF